MAFSHNPSPIPSLMAFPAAFSRSIISFSTTSSNPSSSSPLCTIFKTQNESVSLMGYHGSYRHVALSFCSSGVGSSSDPVNGSLDEVRISKSSYKWRRVLLKATGEALAGDQMRNIYPKVTMAIAKEIAAVLRLGIEVAIVVGGGNTFRGASLAGCSCLDRTSAYNIGMLATVTNAIFLQSTM